MSYPDRMNQFYFSYIDAQAKINGVKRYGDALSFSVNPAVQQRLEKAKMESSPFLKEINSFGVTDLEGEKVTVSIRGSIASTNDSTDDRRQPQSVHDESARRYRCEKTNYDTYIPYTYIDTWAGRPEILSLISQLIAEQEASDRLKIGFNGVTRAAKSNRQTNPLLQDVNIGWLQKIRNNAPYRVVKDIEVSSFNQTGKLIKEGRYANLNAVVFDVKNTLLDVWHRQAPGLVAIVGSNLFTRENFKIINTHTQYAPNMDMLAGNELLKLNSLAGLPVVQVPFFPDGTILITTFKNLSVYWQKDRQRRDIKNEPEYNRIATYSSNNEGYEVEDYGLACLIEGIKYAAPDVEPSAQPENVVNKGA